MLSCFNFVLKAEPVLWCLTGITSATSAKVLKLGSISSREMISQ